MADQICYAVLCVFSYVAAGTEKRIQLTKASGAATGTASPLLSIPRSPKPQELPKDLSSPKHEACSPSVPPPAPPPGMKSFGVPAQLSGTRPLKPPPVPSRNLPPGVSPPQPPPRPK